MNPSPLPAAIRAHQPDVEALCRRAHARRLDLFGSAARGSFVPGSSDLDFVVDFKELTPGDYSDAYFILKQGLEEIFGAPVDLLTERSVRNPFLKDRLTAERIQVYEG